MGFGWDWMGLDGIWMGLDGIEWDWMGLDGIGWISGGDEVQSTFLVLLFIHSHKKMKGYSIFKSAFSRQLRRF